MAAMVYKFQGEADAKTLLFQWLLLTFLVRAVQLIIFFLNFSIGLNDSPIEGLFSGCALGILHDDKQMAKLVLEELKQHESNPTVIHHIAFLTSQFYLKMVFADDY